MGAALDDGGRALVEVVNAIAIQLPTRRQQAERLLVLLAAEADVNAKDRPCNTPLHYAARQDHKDVAELLLAQGADVNARDLLSRTPLYWASVRFSKERVCKDVVELLHGHGGK